jgi:hypothetical protein
MNMDCEKKFFIKKIIMKNKNSRRFFWKIGKEQQTPMVTHR